MAAPPTQAAIKPEDFQNADLACDLVMKGGITSGVVYPAAVIELAKRYKFRSIGGASAGAIAAAGAAAAELGRDSKEPDAGFVGLHHLRDELTTPGFLLRLFRPVDDRRARTLFRVFVDILDGVPARLRALHFALAPGLITLSLVSVLVTLILFNFYYVNHGGEHRWTPADAALQVRTALAFAAAAFLVVLFVWNHVWRRSARPPERGWFSWLFDRSGLNVAWVYAIAAFGLGFFIASFFLESNYTDRVWRLSAAPETLASAVIGGNVALLLTAVIYWFGIGQWMRVLTRYRYGVATGAGRRGSNGELLPNEMRLTDYLHEKLNQLAGLSGKGQVLTFDHLNKKQVCLRLMASNLSLQKPAVLPFPEDTLLLFKRSEMEALFPPDVVDHLVKSKPKHDREQGRFPIGSSDLHYLPVGDDLPVIVAVRMSLAHPGLFSAIPLYTVTQDFIVRRNGEPSFPLTDNPKDVREILFSDGGIVSNFPIHMFDRWFPDVPTFGINLAESLRITTEERTGREVVDLSYLVCPQGIVKGRDPDHPGPEAVHLPKADEVPVAEWRPVRDLMEMVWAIFYTAKNHRLNAQTELPTFRERIVTVRLSETQGGMNLNMPPDVVAQVAALGEEAGRLLVYHYASPPPPPGMDQERPRDPQRKPEYQFDHHRWIRLRLALAHLERELILVRDALDGGGIPAEPPPEPWPNPAGDGPAEGSAPGYPFGPPHLLRLLDPLPGDVNSSAYPFPFKSTEDRRRALATLRRLRWAIESLFPRDEEPVFDVEIPAPEGIKRIVPMEGDVVIIPKGRMPGEDQGVNDGRSRNR